MIMVRNVVRWFGSWQITTKISLSYGLLLTIIVMEMIIGYVALAAVWRANNAIQASGEVQRLVMTIGRNWEAARRLQREFSLQSVIVGADEAYRVHALASAAKITEVIRDGATLKRLAAAPDASAVMRERVADLDLILTTVSDYATAFETATKLELRLDSTDVGLQNQLAEVSTVLTAILTGDTESTELSEIYYEMRFFAEYGRHLDEDSALTALADAPERLQRAIAASSLPSDQKALARTALDNHQRISGAIVQTEAQIREELAALYDLGERIEPNLLALMAAVNAESGQVRAQMEQTRQLALLLMAGAVLTGVLVAPVVVVWVHHNVTRKITRLTSVASQLQAGDLSARAPLDSTDELGQLAATLNAMAAELTLTIDRLDVVREAALELATELDPGKVTAKALNVAATLSGAEAGCIALVDGNQLVLAQIIGPSRPVAIGARLPAVGGIITQVLTTQRTQVWLDGAAKTDDDPLFPPNYAHIVLPLISAQNSIGVLILAAQNPRCFADATLRFLELYSTGAAVAIHNAQMHGAAQHLALADTLTGVYNRRGLAQQGQHVITQALRHWRPVSAIFLDIDHFKEFNDRYSYEVGDLVLRTIAACLRANVRKVDLVCRYGGEEFVLLLSGMGHRDAVELAERLRQHVAAERVQTAQGLLTVTASLGVATLTPDLSLTSDLAGQEMQLLHELLDRAGQMLHVAKAGGRNRVAAAGATSGPLEEHHLSA